jgi:hypothetical protein
VLQLFPFLAWLAAATSVVVLLMLAAAGELRLGSGLLLAGAVLAAGCCQFWARSALLSAAGLAVQTLLAIALIVRWRLRL